MAGLTQGLQSALSGPLREVQVWRPHPKLGTQRWTREVNALNVCPPLSIGLHIHLLAAFGRVNAASGISTPVSAFSHVVTTRPSRLDA